MSRARPAWPGTGRITLALLAVVPAIMAYPWRSSRDQWVLGAAGAIVLVLLSWWRGQHVTTLLGRRLGLARRRRGVEPRTGDPTRTTALLRIEPLAAEAETLPLPLIGQYLARYGIRADAVRVTSRDDGSGVRGTWIGLTVSAVDNLAALRARSARIPLPETVQVAARRLADHLREVGWAASVIGPEAVPQLFTEAARESWRGLVEEGGNYVAAYGISPAYLTEEALPDTLAEIWSYPAQETWTALELAGDGSGRTLAAACAFRTVGQPEAAPPLAGLTSQGGNHRPALAALDPVSTQRLDGHTRVAAEMLAALDWPAAVTEAVTAAGP